MTSMTDNQVAAFLEGRRNAVVATLHADGSVQLSPVWYVMDGGKMYISTSNRSVKMRNLRSDPRISVCVEGGHDDFRYVTLSGSVHIVEHGDELQQRMRRRIIRRYHDSDEGAQAYADSTDDGTQVLLVLEPHRIYARDYN